MALAAAQTALAELEAELDAPQRAYQSYLSQMTAWEQRRLEIVGSPTTPDSLMAIDHELADLQQAPKVL